jgi:hypothetical protein
MMPKVMIIQGGVAKTHRCSEHCPWHGPPETVVARMFKAIRHYRGEPRAKLFAELHAIAFHRQLVGTDYQLAWDASTDPVMLYEAIYATEDEGALALLGEALGRIGLDMERAYDDADPMTWPDAPQRKQHLVVALHEALEAGNFLLFLLTALEAHIYVTDDAEGCRRNACNRLRYYFPNSPWGFAGGGRANDEHLIARGLALEAVLPPKVRSYVQALSTRPLPLREPNREKLCALLREHTAWM